MIEDVFNIFLILIFSVIYLLNLRYFNFSLVIPVLFIVLIIKNDNTLISLLCVVSSTLLINQLSIQEFRLREIKRGLHSITDYDTDDE